MIALPHSAQVSSPVKGKLCLCFDLRGFAFRFNIFCTASNNAGEIIGSKIPSINGKYAYLKKLESENADVRHSSNLFVQNLKNDISAVSARLSRLTDACLNEALELSEYLERKNALTAEKRALEEKLSDFERKGNHWLELMRNWILEANQAGNLIKQENLSGMKDFLADIGSNRRVAAGVLLAEFKMPWRDLAEIPVRARAFGASEVNLSSNSELWT